jgi:hypothetical protein
MKLALQLCLAITVLLFAEMFLCYSQEKRNTDDADNPLAPGATTSVIYIGPVVGYNKSMHTGDIPSFAMQPLCPYFDNGNSNGFYAGLSWELPIAGNVNSRHSIITRILYNSMPASFTRETDDNYPSLIENGSQYDVVNTSTTNKLDIKYSMVSLEAMYKFNVIDRFGLGLLIGPTFDFTIQKKLTQKLVLNGPNNVQFRELTAEEQKKLGISIVRYEDNDRTIVVNDEDIPDASGFRLGIKVGLQYQILMKGGFFIVPSVYYNFAVNKFVSNLNWRVNAFQAGVDVRFAL